MAKVVGYARVSSGNGQDVASQKAALEAAGATFVLAETGNGSKLDGRDQLETAIRILESGDVLLALHPDRIARDTGDLLTVARRVVERGATLKIIDPAIAFDGTDVMAEVMLTIFGLIGRIEKYFLKARQRRGIDAAKAKGIYRGRKPSVPVDRVKALAASGVGPTEIAKALGVSRASVYRALK